MADLELKDLAQDTLANSAGIISVDGNGNAKRINKDEFDLKKITNG
ncbi:hypothetical protein [Abyssogena phaseoliformis symbiont]|nr:hypothetical protein [Abyssogena phaseoliformis symbiont]MBW5289624.1 hypothetical protein [Candidatus Ruthia sp. Apha_13_S6]